MAEGSVDSRVYDNPRAEESRAQARKEQSPSPAAFHFGVHPTKDDSSIAEFIYSGKTIVDVSFDCGYAAKTTRASHAQYKEPSVLDLSHPYCEKRISTEWNIRSRIIWRRLDAARVMSVLEIVETSHRVPRPASSATPAAGRPARMITARTFRNDIHSFSCKLQLIP